MTDQYFSWAVFFVWSLVLVLSLLWKIRDFLFHWAEFGVRGEDDFADKTVHLNLLQISLFLKISIFLLKSEYFLPEAFLLFFDVINELNVQLCRDYGLCFILLQSFPELFQLSLLYQESFLKSSGL